MEGLEKVPAMPRRFPLKPLRLQATAAVRPFLGTRIPGGWSECRPTARRIPSTATWRSTQGWLTTPTGYTLTLSLGRPWHGRDPARGGLHRGSGIFRLPQVIGFFMKSMAGSMHRVAEMIWATCGFGRKSWGGLGPTKRFTPIFTVPRMETGCISGAVTREEDDDTFTIFPPSPFLSKSERTL